MITWQHAEADALEVKAENIEAALIALRRVEGLFDTQSERAVVTSALDTLGVKATNLLSEADKLRKEVSDEPLVEQT